MRPAESVAHRIVIGPGVIMDNGNDPSIFWPKLIRNLIVA